MGFFKKLDTEDIVFIKKKNFKQKSVKRAFAWTKRRVDCFLFCLNFFFFWEFFVELVEVRLEKTVLLDNFLLEVVNIKFINYFVAFFQKEVKNYPIIFLLNQIYYFNLFLINFYNFFCIYYCEKSEMFKNHSYLVNISKNKIDGKVLEISTGFTITPGKYKRYFRNTKNEDINLDNFEFKDEFLWDEFFGKPALADDYQPYNMNTLIAKYSEELENSLNNEEEQSEWETIYGTKGFYDLRFLYSRVNRLRVEEKEFITDPYFYYKNLNRLRIDFFVFDEMVLRIQEIFVCGWLFLLKDNRFFNKKWNFVENFIYTKSVFLLKIDLNTFLYFTHFLSYFRNHMYNKYIYTHHKLYSRMLYRLSYISKFKAPFEEKFNYEYMKDLKNKHFFIVNFKKQEEAIYCLTLEKLICKNLYYNSVFMNKHFFDKEFLIWLSFLIKDLDLVNINYLLYENLLEKAGVLKIERWFFYRYNNMDHYLNKLSEEKIMLFSYITKSVERQFILQLLSNVYIDLYYLIIDNFIFFSPSKMHKFFFSELKFFFKFVKISIAYFFKKKLCLNMINNFVELKLNLWDEDLWFKWFLNKFKYYDLLNRKTVKIEVIDYFSFWICRKHRINNWNASVYDKIFFSKYVSNLIFCKSLYIDYLYIKDLHDDEQHIYFNLNKYFYLNFYKDLILSFINKNIYLNILFYFIINNLRNINFNLNKYFYLRHFVWNDFKKLNL